MNNTIKNIFFGLISFTFLAAGCNVFAAGGAATPTAAAPTPAAAAKEEHVKSTASQEIGKRRQLLIKEAISANDEILHAIFSLEKKDTKEAFKMLEKADGQLSVLLARDPKLKLAPIDVRASTYDLENSPDTIQKIVKDAKLALDNGQIQSTRALLLPLTSEMRIYTDYLPLEIYPDAIKRASKAIQEAKPNTAEAILADALGSVVTTEDVIPLPPLKAEGDVLEAERLYNKDKVKNRNKVSSLLISADMHLANAKDLGYGEYQVIRDEITSIKSQLDAGKPDLFGRIKILFHEITHGNKS
jgi:hypothetical protein